MHEKAFSLLIIPRRLFLFWFATDCMLIFLTHSWLVTVRYFFFFFFFFFGTTVNRVSDSSDVLLIEIGSFYASRTIIFFVFTTFELG